MKIMASYISDGKVVAMTETACYVYRYTINQAKTEKLLKHLAKTSEINTDHWILEWEKSACGN